MHIIGGLILKKLPLLLLELPNFLPKILTLFPPPIIPFHFIVSMIITQSMSNCIYLHS